MAVGSKLYEDYIHSQNINQEILVIRKHLIRKQFGKKHK